MNRIVIMLTAMVAAYWVWALFGESPPHPAKRASPAPAARPTAASAAPVRRDVAGALDPKIVAVLLTLAKAEALCARGVKSACRQLSANDGAGTRQLAAMRRTLGKSCAAHEERACFLRGDIDLQSGRFADASKWLAKSKAMLGRLAARCKDQREKDPSVCAQASRSLAELGARERQIEAQRP